MNELLESLDASIFTPELKEAINAHFEVAVKDMNEAFINEKTAELEVEYTNKIEEKIQELEEKAEEYMAGLEKGISEKEADLEAKIAEYDAKIVETEAKAEEHKTFLDEKAEEYISSKLEEMLDNVDKYLDRIVEEFVDEASDKLDESLKSEKADMIIEAFDAMLIATGVEVSKIVEAKEETEAESKLAESIEKYDTLVEENIELKSQNEKLLKSGIILELKEGLSLVEAQKFERLAHIVDFSSSEKYLEKLQTIKESVKAKPSIEKVEEKVEDNTEEKVIVEKQENKTPIWAHLA
jgi:hypothetical protein